MSSRCGSTLPRERVTGNDDRDGRRDFPPVPPCVTPSRRIQDALARPIRARPRAGRLAPDRRGGRWLKAHAWKVCIRGIPYRGFESAPSANHSAQPIERSHKLVGDLSAAHVLSHIFGLVAALRRELRSPRKLRSEDQESSRIMLGAVPERAFASAISFVT